MRPLRTEPNRKNEEQEQVAAQNFADANKPARTMFVNRAIGRAVFVDAEPDKEPQLHRRCVKPDEVERGASMSEQFQHGSGGSQSRGPKMNRQERAMQKPCGNCSCPDEHAGIRREQSSEDR